MALRILVVPDKFKGTLTAGQAAEAIARGWRQARPRDVVDLLPMSDGGDGFGEVMSRLLGAQAQTVRTRDAAHRPCRTAWWWEPKTKTALIESAGVIGLAMLPPGTFHPFNLDTFGLAAVIQAAQGRGARRCIVGIGGSATNDGGFGLARALGWEFRRRDRSLIERWTDLRSLAEIQAPKQRCQFDELIVAVDVRNPLLGIRGATRVYGPQKGLKADELPEAERNLQRLALVLGRSELYSAAARRGAKIVATEPGAGAAGGLGFGLRVFLGARLEPGFELFARLAKLDPRLRAADVVITGEGSLDASSFMGKGVGQIARRCRALKVPCIALAGVINGVEPAGSGFERVHALVDLTTSANAKSRPDHWLGRLAEVVAASVKE